MTANLQQTRCVIAGASDVGGARRAVAILSKKLGWSEAAEGRAALVATELGTNIAKHAREGELLIGTRCDAGGPCIELLALDKGPGMADIERCFQDGYSRAGSPGTGLGAIRRIASFLDIYSGPQLGTALLARLYADVPRPGGKASVSASSGAVCLPISGETLSGDQWAYSTDAEHVLVLVADGLGHGKGAYEAATTAVRVFSEHTDEPVEVVFSRLHDALRSTRGAAAAIAEILPSRGELLFTGVGNISASIVTADSSKSLVSHNGTVGMLSPRIRSFSYAWSPRSTLVMHSDGVNTRWNLQQYPGLLARDPSTIAGVLYRDFARGRDDVSVVVVREPEVAP